jgi:hypothetical protein
MAAFAELSTEIRMYLPGCPDFLLNKEIRNAAIKFCEESHVWAQTSTLITESGISSYSIPTGEAAVLVTLKNAFLNDKPLTPVANDQLPTDGKTGQPTQYTERGKEIVLYPTPVSAESIVFNLVIKPSRGSTEIADHIAEDYYGPITSYALYRLAMMPERTWSSPNLAAEHFAVYRAGVIVAKAKAQGQVNKVRLAKFSW